MYYTIHAVLNDGGVTYTFYCGTAESKDEAVKVSESRLVRLLFEIYNSEDDIPAYIYNCKAFIHHKLKELQTYGLSENKDIKSLIRIWVRNYASTEYIINPIGICRPISCYEDFH